MDKRKYILDYATGRKQHELTISFMVGDEVIRSSKIPYDGDRDEDLVIVGVVTGHDPASSEQEVIRRESMN